MQLATAQSIAGKIVAELSPFCAQIEVAGSIRRCRPEVNDIDLVVLAKPGMEPAMRERIHRHTRPIQDGPQNLIVELRRPMPFQLDVFIARPAQTDLFYSVPSNWGSLLICRTGSREHNIWLVERAKRLGRRWNPYAGVFIPIQLWGNPSEKCIASATEADVFAALDLAWIEPQKRER